MTTAAEKKHMEIVARLGCVCCQLKHGAYTPAHVHHLLGIKYRAMGKKASNFHVIPLCPEHHQGNLGVHRMGLRAWEAAFYPQDELLEFTNKLVEAYKGRH